MGKQIEFVDLSVRLKERTLYEKLNFTLSDGDRFVLLGPNGIGKSLLLDLVCLGHSRELAGRYEGLVVEGSIVDSAGNNLLNPLVRRKISYVPQNESFFNNMTVKQICESSCNGVEVDLDENRLDYLLNAFGIAEKKNQRVKNNVSFGEAKIISLISRFLKLSATNILIMDEPLNHLSFKNSKVFNDLILEELSRNPTLVIVMVSHCRAMSFTNQALVYSVSDRNLKTMPYQPYDCFSRDEYADCF